MADADRTDDVEVIKLDLSQLLGFKQIPVAESDEFDLIEQVAAVHNKIGEVPGYT